MVLHENNIDESQLKALNLLYVYEQKPGIRRLKRGRGFSFICPEGKTIKSEQERKRLNSIAVPPSYENVWYCPLSNGHLQATGIDSSEKKQYFYHPHWEHLRELTKFNNMKAFGEALPSFRRRISKHLNNPDATDNEERVLSAMFRILDKTGIRIGNERAVEKNKTYGLTTLKKKHVDYDDNIIHFEFKGKGGRDLEYALNDARITAVTRDCEEIPGQHLFDYIDNDGQHRHIHSGQVNAYIKDKMGENFSAKDFRTWRFSCLFLEEALRQSKAEDKVTLTKVLDNVSEISGNTTAILKSSYVHPGLLNIVKEEDWARLDGLKVEHAGLLKSENRLLNYLASEHALAALSMG